MSERPELKEGLDSEVFKEYYYLKEELIDFCRKVDLQVSGGKIEITDRIAHYLKTGEKKRSKPKQSRSIRNTGTLFITPDTYIEENFVCSQSHREFFKAAIGSAFSFKVEFQNWLKENAGKTYGDAIKAYHEIMEMKKTNRTTIAPQFEYNTYIRAFFDDNKGKTRQEAIECWKYKRDQPGHNRYEKKDLEALSVQSRYGEVE